MCHCQKAQGLQEKDRPQTVAGRSGGQPDHAACERRCRYGIHHRQGDGTAKQGEYQHSPL